MPNVLLSSIRNFFAVRERERGRKTEKERADERHEEKERLIAEEKEIVRDKVRKRAEREREREKLLRGMLTCVLKKIGASTVNVSLSLSLSLVVYNSLQHKHNTLTYSLFLSRCQCFSLKLLCNKHMKHLRTSKNFTRKL